MGPPFRILSVCNGGGYRYCRTDPLHPRANANGLYPLHRVLAENAIGRLLDPDEVVHHRDGDKTNDDPANLAVVTRAGHSHEHAVERAPALVALECPVCEATFTLKPHVYRLRQRRNGSGAVACSRSCGGVLSRALHPSRTH